MKAVTVNELGTRPAVRDDLPAPTPSPGDVLVRVRASSAGWKIAVGLRQPLGFAPRHAYVLEDYVMASGGLL